MVESLLMCVLTSVGATAPLASFIMPCSRDASAVYSENIATNFGMVEEILVLFRQEIQTAVGLNFHLDVGYNVMSHSLQNQTGMERVTLFCQIYLTLNFP